MSNIIAGKLLGFIMAHSALIGSTLSDGELLTPYAIAEHPEGREVLNFEAGSQQEAVGIATERLASLSTEVDAWSYSQDGLITIDNGSKQDVFFFKVWVSGMTQPLEAYQPYQSSPFKLLGNVQVINFPDTGLSESDTDAFIQGLDSGIESHPTANKKWDSWFE